MSNLSGQALNDVLQIFGNSICTLLSTVSNLQAPEITQLSSDVVLYEGDTLTSVLFDIDTQIQNILDNPGDSDFDATEYTFEQEFIDKWNILDCLGDIDENTVMTELFLSLANELCECCENITGLTASVELLLDRIITDGGNAVVGSESGNITHSPTSHTAYIYNPIGSNNIYVLNGKTITIPNKHVTFTASKDTYLEVAVNGSYHKVEVGVGDPVPPLESSLRIWKVTTGGSGVTAVSDLRNTKFISSEFFEDGLISNVHIANATITSAKMTNVIAAGAAGITPLWKINWDDAGRITNYDSALSITGLANGDILRYNLAAARFENYAFSPGNLPAGTVNQTVYYNGAAWAASSFLLNTGALLGIGVTPVHPIHVGESRYIAFSVGTGSAMFVATTGGSLSLTTTYYYKIAFETADGGVGPASVEYNPITTGSALSFRIVITYPPGAKAARIYRSLASNGQTTYMSTTDHIFVDNGLHPTTPGVPSDTDTSLGVEIGHRGIRMGSDSNDCIVDIQTRNPDYLHGAKIVMSPVLATDPLHVFYAVSETDSNQYNIGYYADIVNNDVSGKAFAFFSKNGKMLVTSDGSPTSMVENAIAQFDSETKGLMIPRTTTSRRDSVTWVTADDGLIIFNTTTKKFQGRANTAWVDFH